MKPYPELARRHCCSQSPHGSRCRRSLNVFGCLLFDGGLHLPRTIRGLNTFFELPVLASMEV
ncbi:hypothetical protein I3760_07G072500 [Carya illinoinensis]|nr:hypothetical protein I3760_07G072500 [Carya illinoinensis]